MIPALAVLVVVALAAALYFRKELVAAQIARQMAEADRDRASSAEQAIEEKYRSVIDVDAERDRTRREIDALRADVDREFGEMETRRRVNEDEIAAKLARIEELRAEVAELSEIAHLQDFGFYEPQFDFATSELYKAHLDDLRAQQKTMVKEGRAAVCKTEWTVDGSRTKGLKSTKEFLKLMLRAFNGECDAAVARVRYNNIGVMEARIQKAFDTLNKLGQPHTSSITEAYLVTKVGELRLAYEYYEKRQREAEEQRQIREQMREEEIARREIEKAERDAAKEEERFEKALAQARIEAQAATGAKHDTLAAQIAQLEERLAEAQQNKVRAMSRAQMTRSGHVYVISNVGSFGEDVYKIGMTRRLNPMDRVTELGDASVPFRFDVHAVIYSDDAPGLETKLHRTFHNRRVNLVNERKEFFRVALEEIEREVTDNHGVFEFTLAAEAEEFNKSRALLREREAATGSTSASSPVLADAHERAA